MKKMLFFVNPAAGKEEMRYQLMDVINYFTANGYDVMCHPTQKARDIPEFIAQRGNEFDMIVSCGGDGTLNETVSGLMQLTERPILGYIPAGTVNDFASSLHIPKTIVDATHNIIEGEPYEVDMGGFNDLYFTYVAAFGAFTKVSYATPHSSKQALGRAAYILEGIRSLSDIKPIHVSVTANGTTIEDDVIYGMISNATSVGGFHLMDEDAVSLNDGLNELVLVKAPKLLTDYNAIVANALARNFNTEHFHIMQSNQFDFRFDTPIPWTVDGEFAGETTDASITNINTPIRIMVPKREN